MNYFELKISVTPNTEINRDVISSLLAAVGFESFMESEKGLTAYVAENLFDDEAIAGALENFPVPEVAVKYESELIKSRDWNEEWERNFFRPIIIRDKVVIHSSFHDNIPELPYDIIIDPKMAFGTGHHSTTALMVSFMLEQDIQGKSLLDMGCGTAVLAILAHKTGAGRVVAIDNDEWAYNNSIENIRMNQASTVQVYLGDASLLTSAPNPQSHDMGCFDFIFANINRNILLNDIPVYAACLNRGASLFLSGFYMEDLDGITEKCRKHSLKLTDCKEDNRWVAAWYREN